MRLKIKSKLMIGFGVVLIFFLINIIVSIRLIENSKQNIQAIKDSNYKQVECVDNMNVSVIQVQQFLTDASLTKSADSFDDAKKYEGLFHENMNKLKELAPQDKERLNKIDEDFKAYYQVGMEMAQAYVKEGTEKGNQLMDQFDPMAENMSNQVTSLNINSKKKMNDALTNTYEIMNRNINFSLVLGSCSFLFTILIILLLGNRITHPINNMHQILKDLEMGEGDLTKRIEIKTQDELGTMSKFFNGFMNKLAFMIKNIKSNTEVISMNAQSLSNSGGQAAENINTINSNMEKVNTDSKNISESVSSITLSVYNIAQSTQETAVSVQEICDMTDEINEVASQSGNLAQNTKNEMKKIEELSAKNLKSNEDLGKQAEEIKEILISIQYIAEQTNLLALNASIEASRAGEQGKGFTVVAEEIRKLSENNEKSAKKIESIITNIYSMIKNTIRATIEMGDNIEKGNDLVEKVHDKMENIIKSIEKINFKMQSIAAASEEQSASIEELACSMDEIQSSNEQIGKSISMITGEVHKQNTLVSDFNSMAKDLDKSSISLQDLISKFKIDN